ncbi:MAG: hypothetical protein AAGF83_26590 [Cyanobacteria bacterium P01_G01_bin.67]
MIIDLDESFNRAINLAPDWSIEYFFSTVKALRKAIYGTILRWDFQDLEHWSDFTGLQINWIQANPDEKTWGAINKGKKTVTYLRTDLPLLILLDKYAEIIQNEAIFKRLEIIYSPDFYLKTYAIKQKTLEQLFVRRNQSVNFFLFFVKNFNLNKFSIKEFWWFSIIPPPENVIKLDLTDLFIKSNYNKKAITLDELFVTADKIIKSIPKSILNYEYFEAWATITTPKKTVCIIGVNNAVIFVLNEYVDIIQQLVDWNYILVIPVYSFEIQEYKIDKILVQQQFPLWNLEDLPSVFSIYDFIFQTS